jgi:hypothetical protein
MTFLKNLFHTDPDAGPAEKFITYFVPIFVFVVLAIAFLMCWEVLQFGFIYEAARLTGFGGKLLGTVLLFAAAVWAWANETDRVPFRVNQLVATLLLVILIIFSLLAYTGFQVENYK